MWIEWHTSFHEPSSINIRRLVITNSMKELRFAVRRDIGVCWWLVLAIFQA